MVAGFKSLLRDLKRAAGTIRKYENWIDVAPLILKGRSPRTVVLRGNIRIEGPEESRLCEIIDEVFFDRVYTPDALTIGSQDTVVDIGSNIGVFALLAATWTSGPVHAYEPHPANSECLRQNARQNDCSNIVIHPLAVSDRVEVVRLFLDSQSGGHLLFDHNIRGRLNRYIEVPSTTLPRILDDNHLDRIDFLKMDCEGSEGAILRSTPQPYLERIGKIALEFHDNVSALDHEGIRDLMVASGFETMLKWDGTSPFGYVYGVRLR